MDNIGIAGLIDAVIVFALLECAALALLHRVSGTGVISFQPPLAGNAFIFVLKNSQWICP